MADSTLNPFDNAFEMLGVQPDAVTDGVNATALEQLTRALTERSSERGRMILLRSPRAGFGKTHLLLRLHQRVAHSHEFISLEPTKGKYLDAQTVLDAVLRRFSRILPASGGMTVLDLLARQVFATALEPLVRSGDVPSQDRNSALNALRARPVETFDFHNEDAVTAVWAKANFAQLGPRLTAELAGRIGAGFRPVAWWVELLFRYSSAELEQNTRNSSLFETVFGDNSVETDLHEKLVTLLNLTGLITSPVLVLDEVEGFSSNPEAALQVATFLNALHQSCTKLVLIISVNGDVWETAFLPRLPCGLKDRLSDIVIDLKPLEQTTAEQLINDRAGDDAPAILDRMDFDTGVVYARGLVREASEIWDEIEAKRQKNRAVSNAAPISLQQASDPDQIIVPPVAEVTEPVETLTSPAPIAPATPVVDQLATSSAESVAEAESLIEPVIPDPVEPLEPEAPTESEEQIDALLQNPILEPLIEASQDPETETASPFEPAVTPVAPMNEPQIPDAASIPDPFGRRNEPAAEAETFAPQETLTTPAASPFEPEPVTPSAPEPVLDPVVKSVVEPQNIIQSPFSIDTSVAPPSPFEPAADPAPEQASGAPIPTPEAPVAPVKPAASPFQVDPNQPAHSVTEQDHDKVEDLLRQFRDRYGRDE